jgi:type VI protein secretion system component Hcp
MTTHSTTRTVLRALIAGLIAAGLSAVWPLSAQAGKSGGGGHVQTHDISVTKTADKASPNLYRSTAKGEHYRKVILMTRKGEKSDTPKETINLNYNKVEWKY